jgi:ornithine decarboxylase
MVRGRQRRGDRQGRSVKADAKLYLRIDAPNIGSDWPLAGKFGAHMHDVPELIQAAWIARPTWPG